MTATASTVVSEISAERWIEWAAECSAQHYPDDSLKAVMRQHGIEDDKAQVVLDKVKTMPLYKSLERATQKYQRAYSVLENFRKLQEQHPFYHRIERVAALTLEEFFYDYWLKCRPVIITDMAKDWPIRETWTFERLLKDFADEEIEIQFGRESDPNFEINSGQHKKKVKLGWFVQTILDQQGDTNNIYMTANNKAFVKTRLKELIPEIGQLPPYMSTDPDCLGWRNFWVGPKGTVTPFHHDTCALIHLHVQGRKLWRLVSPFDYGNVYNHNHVFSPVDIFNIDYQKYSQMANVRYFDVIVEPGETLFVPLGWWHGVKSLDKTISISMIDFAFPNNCWDYSQVREIA